MTSSNLIFGRVWIYDTGDSHETDFWCHELEPMYTNRRPITEWVQEYFNELNQKQLRKMFELPEEGNYQIIFSGRMISYGSYDDYDEEFDLNNFDYAIIPEEMLKMRLGPVNHPL